jgi:regulator of replication initiation timing
VDLLEELKELRIENEKLKDELKELQEAYEILTAESV